MTDLSGLWDRMKKALGLGGPPGGGAAADAGAARGTAVGPSRGVAKSSPRGRTEGALPARPEDSPPGRPGDMVQAFIDGLLHHHNPDVRAGAARKLGEIGPRAGRRAVDALARALADDDPGVRSSAALSLADFGAEAGGCADALVELLGDEDDDVRSSAGVALHDIGPAGREALERALQHANPLIRVEAQMLLQRSGDDGGGSGG